jgi:hypothetical protein
MLQIVEVLTCSFCCSSEEGGGGGDQGYHGYVEFTKLQFPFSFQNLGGSL